MSWREIKCPQCGGKVKIPWFWILGIEGIFRCQGCKLSFKTGYKMGAVLFALSLSLGVATLQSAVYAFSIYSMPLFVLLAVPAWIFYGFWLRRWYMVWKIRRRLKRNQ